jgi:hypothetical protein
MWPVFVFGTGRCGSTHIQRLITLSTCCWIWGEHDGFLEPLLRSVRQYETSKVLERAVFHESPRSDDHLISDMALGSERLSWLNRLDKAEFRTRVASLVDRMFGSPVPDGWTQWGFKEILYGLDNDAPATLLNLFPNATAVFTFRDPKNTIESMIRTWSSDILYGPPSANNLCKMYRMRVQRWKMIVEYFLKYRGLEVSRIVFISAEKLKWPVGEILHALGLSATRQIAHGLKITNPGPVQWPAWASSKFHELFQEDEAECLGLFARACAQSDADFGMPCPVREESFKGDVSNLSARQCQATTSIKACT